jgi:antitoxin MazE
MKVSLVKIGNSQGIRIPKALIDQCGFSDAIELEVKEGALVLRPAKPSREGWDAAFAKHDAAEKPGTLLPDHMSEAWDKTEWTW